MKPSPGLPLDADDIERMRREKWPCHVCGEAISRNYCQECNEYFLVGHQEKCTQRRGIDHYAHASLF
jgi:hypothetical protein